MRESGNCRTTDGALSSSSSLGNRGKKRATKLTRQKLFHYMPTLHSGGGSSFWRDGWQRSLRARRRTREFGTFGGPRSEEKRKGMEEWRVSFCRERERKASLTAAVSVHTLARARPGRLRQMLPPGSDTRRRRQQFPNCLPYCQIIIAAIITEISFHPDS